MKIYFPFLFCLLTFKRLLFTIVSILWFCNCFVIGFLACRYLSLAKALFLFLSIKALSKFNFLKTKAFKSDTDARWPRNPREPGRLRPVIVAPRPLAGPTAHLPPISHLWLLKLLLFVTSGKHLCQNTA